MASAIEGSIKEKLLKVEKALKKQSEENEDLKLDLNEYVEQEKSQSLEINLLRQ